MITIERILEQTERVKNSVEGTKDIVVEVIGEWMDDFKSPVLLRSSYPWTRVDENRTVISSGGKRIALSDIPLPELLSIYQELEEMIIKNKPGL